MIPFSVLDLCPVPDGSDAGQALRNTRDLAGLAESLGYRRYWLAEHHNMTGIASAATAVVAGFVAEGTRTIRVGSGGVMLPNHSPLVIAEQFGTLAALYPGRIDLGLGRAPGSDGLTARALRRGLADADDFPRDVLELQHYFAPSEPGQRIQAVPGAGLDVPLYILGSSTYGGQLAAALGVPHAFASHFAPAQMRESAAVYRQQFQPSERWPKPHMMFCLNVTAADTDAEARHLFTSVEQQFINLRLGTPGKLPAPLPDRHHRWGAREQMVLQSALSEAIVGSRETVRRGLEAFVAEHRPDEILVTAMIHDHAARRRSFEIVAEVRDAMAASAPISNAA
ncbi:LLM class flavin-dependent oxidoreductase [Lichenibacterium ramalinae]|uniref:Luciferase-like monooxygenase n=1 Tax=Lichenibacterium ramalinae TaxID=2316527 RepID=A0A4Q2RGN4_9HYPH|nr:LLM class flavin-dependent oxidoreductase [Lichenibacterium ramalinae]RYB07629.1 LLM class flavin-dependent oxidoreductase [Lichenibacterium ramalinae]